MRTKYPNKVYCEQCGKEFEITNFTYKRSKTKRFFCSRSCSAKYTNSHRDKPTEETKKKTSESLRKYYKENGRVRVCKLCAKEYSLKNSGATERFCSQNCLKEYRAHRKQYLSEDTISRLSAAGRHSVDVQSENRRSKNEKLFCELCEKQFKNVKHNESIFNGWDADIIIEDIKVAILWNGKWHYEKIKENHSVEQVQNRDKIKIKEIKNCGYKPYIVKDMGKFNQQFVESEFEKFMNIYSGMEE